MSRYRVEGEAAFEPQSRRPKTTPTEVGTETVELIVDLRQQLAESGLDAGPHTIQWHLQRHHDIDVSVSTIRRRLIDAGMVTPEPKNDPARPTFVSRPTSRTSAGRPISPTGVSLMEPMSRS